MFTDWELKINFAIRIPRNVFSDVFELFCLAEKKKQKNKKHEISVIHKWLLRLCVLVLFEPRSAVFCGP